jgi:hypothetical protein
VEQEAALKRHVLRHVIVGAACFAITFTGRHAGAQLEEAAAFHAVAKSAAPARERELAQLRVAIALDRFRFHQSAYAIFSEIADHPNHAAFQATLPWLAKLSTDLPEPADIDERVGKYDEASIDKLATYRSDVYWQLSYLLGRYRYRNRQYGDALRSFAKVDRGAKYYAKAQFFSGMTNVQLRRPIEAVASFERMVAAIDAGIEGLGGDDEARMRELGVLSIARTYYSASVRLDGHGARAMDKVTLAAALKHWNAVDVASELWLEALFEKSWAYFMVGDHSRVLGNVHTIQSVFFRDAYKPEVDLLKSNVYVANCQYDDAATLTARFHAKYQPIAIELTKALRTFDGADQDERFFQFAMDVRSAKAKLSPIIEPVVRLALSDRQFLRHLLYVQVIEDEQKRFAKTPGSFRESPLGSDMKDALQLARDIAVRNAAELGRERTKRRLDELNEHLRDNVRLLTGAMAGQRGELDQTFAPWRIPARDADRNVVRADEEHVIWPFTGEFWSDEVGSYRQSIRSKCR